MPMHLFDKQPGGMICTGDHLSPASTFLGPPQKSGERKAQFQYHNKGVPSAWLNPPSNPPFYPLTPSESSPCARLPAPPSFKPSIIRKLVPCAYRCKSCVAMFILTIVLFCFVMTMLRLGRLLMVLMVLLLPVLPSIATFHLPSFSSFSDGYGTVAATVP